MYSARVLCISQFTHSISQAEHSGVGCAQCAHTILTMQAWIVELFVCVRCSEDVKSLKWPNQLKTVSASTISMNFQLWIVWCARRYRHH